MLPQRRLEGDKLKFQIKIGNESQLGQLHIQESADKNLNSVIEKFRNIFERKNQEINKGNQDLRTTIESIIDKRIAEVQGKQDALKQLSNKITISLKKNSETISIVPLRPQESIQKQLAKNKVVQTPAITSKEYVLQRDDFLKLVGYIDRYLRSCERTPIPFNTLEEEHIRDLMLPYLNQVFEGATGETFSKQGKTDIYLVIEEGCILICECKWWTGAKSIEEVIGQVLNRVTWRENYGIVMMFVKGNATTIIDKAKEAIANHLSNTDKSVKQIATNHLFSKNLRKDDQGHFVEIHYLFYNFPPKS